MIDWKQYGDTRETQPPSHELHLISNGNFILVGVHELHVTDRKYGWRLTDGQPINGVTHYAKLHLPQSIGTTEGEQEDA